MIGWGIPVCLSPKRHQPSLSKCLSQLCFFDIFAPVTAVVVFVVVDFSCQHHALTSSWLSPKRGWSSKSVNLRMYACIECVHMMAGTAWAANKQEDLKKLPGLDPAFPVPSIKKSSRDGPPKNKHHHRAGVPPTPSTLNLYFVCIVVGVLKQASVPSFLFEICVRSTHSPE